MKSDSRMIAALVRDEITQQFPDRSFRSLDDEWGLPEGTVGRISNANASSTGGMGAALLPKIVAHLPNLKPWLTDNGDQPGRHLVRLTPEGVHAFRLLSEKEKKNGGLAKKSTKASPKLVKKKLAPKATKPSKSTTKPKPTTKPSKTVIVERNMPIEVIAKLVQIAKNPKTLDQWINLASHIEDTGYKVSALLRAIRNQTD